MSAEEETAQAWGPWLQGGCVAGLTWLGVYVIGPWAWPDWQKEDWTAFSTLVAGTAFGALACGGWVLRAAVHRVFGRYPRPTPTSSSDGR